MGARVPSCHRNGPFSVIRPLRELHPGPPFNLRVHVRSFFSYLTRHNSPYKNFLARIGVRAREEPKVQLSLLIGVLRDGQQAGIGLSNIKVDVRNRGAVHDKLLGLLSQELGRVALLDGLLRGRGDARVALSSRVLAVEGIEGALVEGRLGQCPERQQCADELEMHGDGSFNDPVVGRDGCAKNQQAWR